MNVFLSSTYEDLIEYRNAAKDAIERLDFKADRMQDIAIKIATSLANHIKKVSGDVQVAELRNDSERVRRLNKLEDGILFAAHDLQKRLYNLVRREGYVYLDAQNPMEDIAPSTVYRLGQYFAWVVIWLKNRTDAESLLKTKSDKIFSKMEEISKGFSTDTSFPTQTLRIFTDAQSELGEYFLEGADMKQSCISRYEFNSRLTDPGDAISAFEPIREDISNLKNEIVAGRTDRLNYIQNKLIDLLDILDPEQKKIDIDREKL